jgi:hypothetical protein
MRHFNGGPFRQQASFLRRQFLQDGDLPFTNVLSEGVIAKALKSINFCSNDRIYSPLVTLWVFLGQVLSADHSCRSAVARLISHRVSRGQRPCSSETGAYCQARKRLPEKFFSRVARRTGRALDAAVESQWLWKQRRVYVYDGSSVSMPDTPANQRDYPQPETQKRGLGFPLARIAAIFSLASGAVLDVGICRYAGKGQSELGMLRKLWKLFRPGDVMLADRLMCAWTEMVMLKQRGVDCVCRLTSHRTADFRRGKRLGKDDHLVKWPKPGKPRSIDRETYDTLPDFLLVRECRVRDRATGISPLYSHHRDDVAGCGGNHQERSRFSLSCPLECRTRSKIAKTDDANEGPEVQDSRTGTQGTLDPHPGIQPYSNDHGSSRYSARNRTTLH